jgi:hypothetical protein
LTVAPPGMMSERRPRTTEKLCTTFGKKRKYTVDTVPLSSTIPPASLMTFATFKIAPSVRRCAATFRIDKRTTKEAAAKSPTYRAGTCRADYYLKGTSDFGYGAKLVCFFSSFLCTNFFKMPVVSRADCHEADWKNMLELFTRERRDPSYPKSSNFPHNVQRH